MPMERAPGALAAVTRGEEVLRAQPCGGRGGYEAKGRAREGPLTSPAKLRRAGDTVGEAIEAPACSINVGAAEQLWPSVTIPTAGAPGRLAPGSPFLLRGGA